TSRPIRPLPVFQAANWDRLCSRPQYRSAGKAPHVAAARVPPPRSAIGKRQPKASQSEGKRSYVLLENAAISYDVPLVSSLRTLKNLVGIGIRSRASYDIEAELRGL